MEEERLSSLNPTNWFVGFFPVVNETSRTPEKGKFQSI